MVMFKRDELSKFEPGVSINHGSVGVIDLSGKFISGDKIYDYEYCGFLLDVNIGCAVDRLRKMCDEANKSS